MRVAQEAEEPSVESVAAVDGVVMDEGQGSLTTCHQEERERTLISFSPASG